VRDPSRTTEDAARRPQIPANGAGGTKVELAKTWERIERLHAQRFSKEKE
jgi:hypothetical protein